jgi:hypothetical protein
MTETDCVFCDLTQFRAADVCIENGFCLYASTRDPRDEKFVRRCPLASRPTVTSSFGTASRPRGPSNRRMHTFTSPAF